VARVRSGAIKDSSRALRGLREFRLSATIWRKARDFFTANRCDLIVFYSPSIFFGGLVARLKALWGCPAYLVLRDIFPQWAVDAGVIRKGLLYRYLRRKELAQYDAAEVIGAEGEGDLEYFRHDPRLSGRRVEVLSNWMDTQQSPPTGSKYREQLGLQGRLVFFYGGNIGVAQDPDNLVRLALSLKERPETFVLLVGSGSEAPRLEREIERLQLGNIRILPPLPQAEYMQCLAEFDVGLVSLDRRLQTHNSTGKLLGYLFCGKPVLASLNPGNGLAKLLRESGAGIACENGDDRKLREAAMRLAGDIELRARMGRNARLLLESRFSVQAAAARILSHFQQPASDGSPDDETYSRKESIADEIGVSRP